MVFASVCAMPMADFEVFVNEQDVRFLQGEQTVIRCGDAVTIIPAFAGG